MHRSRPSPDCPEQQAGTGRFSNSSDYVRDLIRRDQERADKLHEMQRLILEGIQSGTSARSMEEIFESALVKAAILNMAWRLFSKSRSGCGEYSRLWRNRCGRCSCRPGLGWRARLGTASVMSGIGAVGAHAPGFAILPCMCLNVASATQDSSPGGTRPMTRLPRLPSRL